MMAIKIEFDTMEELEYFASVFHQNINQKNETLAIDSVDEQVEAEIVVEEPASTEETVTSVAPVIPYDEVYRYDFYKCYFKTPKGRGGRILITGSEALEIIPLIKQGKGARSIWNQIGDFYHDEVTLSTLNTFKKRYNEGKLDTALTMYCQNWRVQANPLEYVKNG